MKWLIKSLFGGSAIGPILPWLLIGILVSHIGAYGYGHLRGKAGERLKWEAAQAELLRQKAKATRAREDALAKADAAELRLSETQRQLDQKTREDFNDVIAASKVDSTFRSDPAVSELFDTATGIQPGPATGTNPRPCPSGVPGVSESTATCEGGAE